MQRVYFPAFVRYVTIIIQKLQFTNGLIGQPKTQVYIRKLPGIHTQRAPGHRRHSEIPE